MSRREILGRALQYCWLNAPPLVEHRSALVADVLPPAAKSLIRLRPIAAFNLSDKLPRLSAAKLPWDCEKELRPHCAKDDPLTNRPFSGGVRSMAERETSDTLLRLGVSPTSMVVARPSTEVFEERRCPSVSI